MMRHAPAALLIAFVWLLIYVPTARGAFIPWQYSWARSPEIVYSDSSSTSYITLTDEPLRQAAGTSNIVATNLKVFSDAAPADPATFTDKGYTLTLFLLDVQSNQSGTVDFTGLINGVVSQFSADLENTFTGQATVSIVLGNHLYTVTVGPYTPPGPPESSNLGAIGARATVTVTEIQKVPEPSTLLLALCGGGLMLGYRRWRRRPK